jgi:hypothetical protein
MKKLKLELDALRVETFAALEDGAAGPGSVHGRDARPSPAEPCWTDRSVCNACFLTEDPYNPCNTDEGSCANGC